MKGILKILRKLLGIEKSVEAIVSPLTRIVDELEQHAQDQADKSLKELERARKLEATAKARDEESKRAVGAAAGVKKFLAPAE